ncbi:phosphoribosyltransferase [Patescibacteria group bacterium]
MFKSRKEAGKLLGKKIKTNLQEELGESSFKNKLVVLGIPRGGVVIGKEVANILGCFLDVIVVKKLAAPGQQELAIGAIGETAGSNYIDKKIVKELNISKRYLTTEIAKKKEEIKNREKIFRANLKEVALQDKIVIIVDDGAATGATIIAAIREVWNSKPKKVIVGLPVLALDTLEKLENEADEVIFLEAPTNFFAVGQFYQEFAQVEDEKVINILRKKP